MIKKKTSIKKGKETTFVTIVFISIEYLSTSIETNGIFKKT